MTKYEPSIGISNTKLLTKKDILKIIITSIIKYLLYAFQILLIIHFKIYMINNFITAQLATDQRIMPEYFNTLTVTDK